MSSYGRKNFFEVLGAFVPGYKGYSEKEMRRESDRILRDAIVSRLQDKKTVVDGAGNRRTFHDLASEAL